MAEALNVEGRLAALEKEVAALRQRLEQLTEPKKTGLAMLSGSWADVSEEDVKKFREICAEIRRSDRTPDDE